MPPGEAGMLKRIEIWLFEGLKLHEIACNFHWAILVPHIPGVKNPVFRVWGNQVP